MKNTNALQIAVILCVIIIIGLIVGLVMMNQGRDERAAELKNAKDRASEAQTAMTSARQEALQLKTLIGHKDDTDLQAIEQQFETDMNRYMKSSDTPTRNYRDGLRKLQDEVVKKNEALTQFAAQNQQLEAELGSLHAQYDEVKKQIAEARNKDAADFQAEKAELAKTTDAQRQLAQVQTREKEQAISDAERQVKTYQTEKEAAQLQANKTAMINKGLTETMTIMKRDIFEQVDGKILSVNQRDGTVVVNVGKGDGLRPRMTFSVYRPSITGISFGSDHEDSEANICDVCKRTRANAAAKASIEIIELLADPHKARARILDDMLTDPIVPGDGIFTPVWKPGQVQRFALGAGMRVHGMGRRDGRTTTGTDLDRIIQLIKDNGGQVDAYISEGDDDHKRGEIVGEITQNTTFLVTSDLTDDDNINDQAIMESQAAMEKDADAMAIKRITLSQLLSMMGWKNVTPIRGFGSALVDSDLEMKPEWRAPSTGGVSSLYRNHNYDARVSPDDHPRASSTGTVSNLYLDTPVSGKSTGTVSDLFRTRQPGAERSGSSE